MNITENIRFSRNLFLEESNNRVLILYPCTDCDSNLCVKYWQGSAQDAPLRHLRKKIADGAKNPTRWARGRIKFF